MSPTMISARRDTAPRPLPDRILPLEPCRDGFHLRLRGLDGDPILQPRQADKGMAAALGVATA